MASSEFDFFKTVDDEERGYLKSQGIRIRKNGEVYKQDRKKAENILKNYREGTTSSNNQLFEALDKIQLEANNDVPTYSDVKDTANGSTKQALGQDRGTTVASKTDANPKPLRQKIYGVTSPDQIKGDIPEVYLPNGPRPDYMKDNQKKAVESRGKLGKWKGAGMVAGALALGGFALSAASNRGQLSNAQLYGQRPLY